MFHKPRRDTVESDAGFSVQLLGRGQLLYRERGHELMIPSEGGLDGIAVWRNIPWSWQPPHQAEKIDNGKRDEIIENVRQALGFQGDKLVVIG